MSDLPIRLFIATKTLIQYQGLVLILRESNKYFDGTQTGKFDVPGGRMTVMGESYLDSLRREVHEESGLEIDAITPFFVNEVRIDKDKEQWQIVRIFFKVKSQSNIIKLSDDHCEYQWIDAKSYKEYPLIENLYPVFENYISQP